jgi:isoquinoline 1-oxidoreductase beta subunit
METRNLSRRNFMKVSGMAGSVFALGYYLPAFSREPAFVKPDAAEGMGIDLNAWISIDKTGQVTITNHRAEMGQGAYQVVPQMLAEELEADMNKIKVVSAVGNSTKYGSQVTGGSSTVRGSYKRLLRLGATAREMLIEAAARKWNVAHADCKAEMGFVIHVPSGKKISYGELVEEAAKLEAPANVKLKDRRDYKIVGKPLPRLDTPMKVNGKAIFGIDYRMPGLLFAAVKRSPHFVDTIKSVDDSAALRVAGVSKVVRVQRDVFDHLREGIAVIADNTWSALQGARALKVEWDTAGVELHDTDLLYSRMRESLKGEMISFKTQGNFKPAYDRSEKKVEAVYETPYQSHSCMEPLNCTAWVHDDKCEVWGPIQGPDWIQDNLASHLKLKKENVTVNMTFLGGGFGRKAFTDYPYEAAMLSKELNAPVQVVWSREDDMTAGPFRPGMVYSCKGGLNGKSISALELKMAGQNMGTQNPGADKSGYNDSASEGLLDPYFDSIPHYAIGDVPLESHVPVMWWRSVYASTNGFAYESFLDELAIRAEVDPLDFRRRHARNERYQLLFDRLAEVSGWKSRGKNEGWGLAVTECFSSIVGEVVKVSRRPDGKVKIDKVWAVMDCGWYVNPDIIRAQVEGSIVMALGAAVKHETHFMNGMAVESNFDKYKMPGIVDTPAIEVHVMDNDERAGGVGEPGLPPFTPALCNALFDLSGKRIRKLPFKLEEI